MDRICELFRILGNSVDLEETLASFDCELRRHLSYEAISLNIIENGRLLPAYAAGLEFRVLALLECAMGAGFLGRGAEARKPALNESTKKSGGRWVRSSEVVWRDA